MKQGKHYKLCIIVYAVNFNKNKLKSEVKKMLVTNLNNKNQYTGIIAKPRQNIEVFS